MPAPPEVPRLTWCGESYLHVRLSGQVDMWSVARVLRLQRQLADSAIAGCIAATVPGWTTLLLWLDADAADPAAVEAAVLEAALAAAGQEIEFTSRMLTLPTMFGGAAGPDLEFVAGVNGLSVADTVGRLQAVQFAGMVSFSPGMANCMWVDEKMSLTAPKYDSPRTSTPPGTVGLGGSSISLYPVDTPGGFQMVGRLAVPIYQPVPTLAEFADSCYRYTIKPGSCRVGPGGLTWT
jgi:KipI family sensor histidine kinase inhibitor